MNWYFASGDLDFFWKEQLRVLSWLPQVFRPDQGYGTSSLLSLWLDYPFRLILKILSILGLSWFIIEKLLWFAVFALAMYASYRLTKSFLGVVIYTSNTYFLLLFSGGQLGMALAYGFAPLVLRKFMETIDDSKLFRFRRAIINGLLFALLVVFDLRIAYLIIGASMLYLLLKRKLFQFYSFGISLFAASCLHLFWILPTIVTRTGPASLGQDFVNTSMLKFLSVADFSHAISLLHPNWPENLFGKVYFLQPEFLVLPILSFASLFFLKSKNSNKQYFIFFALISLAGAFFAKGVNEPAGSLFQWMFIHVPGFVMFRDPTKFYLYTTLGYAVLIPIFLSRFHKKILIPVFILFWLFTLRAIFLGQVDGNFKPVSLPQEYVRLKNLMVSDNTPSRSLWIPGKENFAFFSDTHPIVTATTSAAIDTSIKYVIVPEDVNHRIFLTDYAFDPLSRKKLIADLLKTRLEPMTSFHDIAVFENPDFAGMQIHIPPIVEKQQRMANIGVGLSAGFLVFFMLCIKLFK